MPKPTKVPASTEPQQFLTGSLVSMGWQLAVVVLLPLLGGNFIDKRLDTLPWFTLVGMILAMTSMIIVVRRALRDVNEYVATISNPKEHNDRTDT